MALKFFRCKHCGQIVYSIKETGSKMICCGEAMEEIIPGSVDAAVEKHVPTFEVNEGKVKVVVGSVEHPMVENHYIEWICLETKKGIQFKYLNAGDEPKRCFRICDCDEVIAVYAYCNLHGLWKKEG